VSRRRRCSTDNNGPQKWVLIFLLHCHPSAGAPVAGTPPFDRPLWVDPPPFSAECGKVWNRREGVTGHTARDEPLSKQTEPSARTSVRFYPTTQPDLIRRARPRTRGRARQSEAVAVMGYGYTGTQSAAYGGALLAGCPSWSVSVSDGVTLTNNGVIA
jgi:hypothetical protein